MSRPGSRRCVNRRRAVVLLLVLLVTVALALAAYTFCEQMLVERRAVEFHGRKLQVRLFAESGVATAMTAIENRSSLGQAASSIQDDPSRFRASLESSNGEGRFTVFSSSDDGQVRYGVLNLSGRLNLNVLALVDDETTAREALRQFPEATDEVIDAILDWIDADDEPRMFGAESNYYESLDPPYRCRNGPLQSLDELVLVRGVSPLLLYGRDINRNGVIDPQEEEDDASSDLAANNSSDQGLSRWLTVNSGETTVRSDGRPRIDVNHPELTELFDRLEAEFDIPTAKFIVAYRMYGPFPEREDARRSKPVSQSPTPKHSATGGVVQAKERAGLMLNAGPRYSIRSVFDLVETQIGYVDETGDLMRSPWSQVTNGYGENLRDLEEAVTVTSARFIPGRINFLEADKTVLSSLPPLTDAMASRIVAARDSSVGSESDDKAALSQLLQEGVLDLESLRKVAPLLTSGGDVFAGQVIGSYADLPVPYCRLEFIVDASSVTPRLLRYRDLSFLGPGWPNVESR